MVAMPRPVALEVPAIHRFICRPATRHSIFSWCSSRRPSRRPATTSRRPSRRATSSATWSL
eukprot:9264985-Heterocapsa_arctica.AAC.1